MIDDYSVDKLSRDTSDMRERLIDCASVMVEGGEADISLRGVARAAGVSAMAPYRHFTDKAALIGAVASRGFGLLRDDLATADRSRDDPAPALIAQGIAYVHFARDRPALFRLMFADPSIATLTPDCDTDAFAVLTTRVASLATTSSGDASLACWSIVHGLATLTLDARIAADDDRIAAVLTLFVQGLTSSSTTVD